MADGYPVLVSSAWDLFHQTEERIRELGLATELQLQDGDFERDHVADIGDNSLVLHHFEVLGR